MKAILELIPFKESKLFKNYPVLAFRWTRVDKRWTREFHVVATAEGHTVADITEALGSENNN